MKQFFAPAILILSMLACTLPTPQEGAPANNLDANATITALAATIQAQGLTATPAPVTVTLTATNTPLPSETPTITPTFTPSVPMVSVSQTTNCRTGPGTQYDLLGSVGPGQSAQLVGKYSAGNYWIINNLNGSGTCWLWGQYATTSGNISSLPEMIPPPTPTPALPTAPKHFDSLVTCSSGGFLIYNVHVVLSWTDMATNEDGYYLYRNDKLIVTLAADSIGFEDDTTLPKFFKVGDPPPSVNYKLQAFNGAGKSEARELSASCP